MKRKRQVKKTDKEEQKRPFAKTDFEAVLKVATKPLKKGQGEKESAKT